MKIGSHVSIKGGLIGATKEAYSYGSNTFMIDTGAFTDKSSEYVISRIAEGPLKS